MVRHLNGYLSKLVYQNDLSDNLVSTVKLFADDASLFSAVRDSNISVNESNKDMQAINI